MPKTAAKNCVILINGYVFSTYFTAYNVEADAGKIDVTGFTDGSQNFVPGMPTAHIDGDVLWDSAAAKTHAALKSMPTGYVSLLPEGSTLGNPSISLPFMQANYNPKGTPTEAIQLGTLNFESYGNNVGVENGVSLQHGTITTTTTGTGVLDPSDAAVTATCSATLHIWTATLTDTYVVKVQHSTAVASGYADLITFVLDGTAIGAERIAVASGTINKYRRILATRTGVAADPFGFSVVFQHQ